MRKIKKNKSNKFVIIIIVYFITFLTISTAYSFLNADLSLSSSVTIGSTQITNNSKYTIDYIVDSRWQSNGANYYHITPTVEYDGDETTTGWKLFVKVPYDTEIVGCWSASTCVVEGEILTITSAPHNSKLNKDNTTATPSFQMKTNEANYEFRATGITFETKTSSIDKTDEGTSTNNTTVQDEHRTTVDYIKSTLNITGGWGNITTYILKITNESNNTIQFWDADITFPIGSSINALWGGENKYDEKTGVLSLEGPSWSPSLGPNGSIEVNIYMDTGNPTPYRPTLGKFKATTSTGEKIISDISLGG